MITKFDMKTPGRDEAERTIANSTKTAGQDETKEIAAKSMNNVVSGPKRTGGFDVEAILTGLGGKENIISLDNCVTRLRIEVKDDKAVRKEALLKAGAKGVIRPGQSSASRLYGGKKHYAENCADTFSYSNSGGSGHGSFPTYVQRTGEISRST